MASFDKTKSVSPYFLPAINFVAIAGIDIGILLDNRQTIESLLIIKHSFHSLMIEKTRSFIIIEHMIKINRVFIIITASACAGRLAGWAMMSGRAKCEPAIKVK